MILSTAKTDEEFGEHCLEHTHPDFRQKVHDGQQIIVAGKAFGVGSSREEAVRALKGKYSSGQNVTNHCLTLPPGLGVKAVIAKSYAFIYGRNQASWGLLGMTVEDDAFYQAATDGVFLKIDIPTRTVSVGEGSNVRTFPFIMSDMEYRLTMHNGINAAYGKFKNELWKHMIGGRSSDSDEKSTARAASEATLNEQQIDKKLQW